MLMLWLGTFALTALPQLHQLLHKDAQALNHHCLITQLQQHLLMAGSAVAFVPAAPITDLPSSPPVEFQFLPTRDHRLSLSRAPPAFSPFATVVG